MSYSIRTRPAIVLASGVAIGTLAFGACGSSGNTSTPAVSIQTRPAGSAPAIGMVPTRPANPGAGISDAAGEHGGSSPSAGLSDALGEHGGQSPRSR